MPNTALASAISESGFRKTFIAERLGVSPSLLSRWLTGERRISDIQREKLALLLRCSADALLAVEPHTGQVSTLTNRPRGNRVGDQDEAA